MMSFRFNGPRSSRGWRVFGLVLACVLSTVAVSTVARARTLSVAPVDTIPLGLTGVRGMTFDADGDLWLLATERTGLSIADSTYTVTLVRYSIGNGLLESVATETDAYESGLAFDGEHLWAGGNRAGGSELLYRIRLEDAVVDSTLGGSGYHPGGLTWGDEYLWQVDSDARDIARIETEEGKISKRISTPGFYPTGVVHNGTHLYCADAASGLVHRLRPRSGRLDGTLDPTVLRRVGEYLNLAWDGRYLWVMAASDDYAVRYEVLP